MTLVFESNEIGFSSDGLDLTVKVVPVENLITYTDSNSGGSVTSTSPTKADINATVNFSYSYDSGYLVKDIKVTAENGDAVKVSGGWYNNKKASFKMPPSNVTVTSTYTNNLTADGDLYINMPKTGILIATIPAGVKSFKVYDDGGKSGNYSKNSTGMLVLKAPDNHVLQLTGTIKTGYDFNLNSLKTICNSGDKLSVYDGEGIAATALLSGKTSDCTTTGGTSETSLGRLQSSGRSMTLVFESNEIGDPSNGLDLTVTLVPVYYTIAVNSASNGSVESDKSKSYVDSVVTLTAKPNSGYMLSDISLSGGANSTIKVSGGWYTNNKATFIMPAYNVTVRPYFTDDIEDGLFINMPKGKTLATIPQGVEYFRIYDNGGSGNYSANSSDTLIIKAPDGYHMFLRGNVTLYRGYDSLYVYDGDNTNANLMYKGSSSAINKETDIGGMLSHSEYMTLYFKSTGDYQFQGLNLNVTVLPAYKINVPASVEGGTVSCNALAAVSGQTITVTATPDDGYKLAGVAVVDAAGNPIEVKTSFTGNLIFSMPNSDVSVTAEFITMHDVNVVSNYGGTLESDKDKAYPGDIVSLTVKPNEFYLLKDIEVLIKDAENTNVRVKVNLESSFDNEATFVMPNGAVQVYPVYINNFSAHSGLFANMPTTGTKTIDIPEYVASFLLYDDGGVSNNYSSNSKGSLVLVAPEGYLLEVSGTVSVQASDDGVDHDDFSVYDANEPIESKRLVYHNKGTQTLESVRSTGRYMSMFLQSDDNTEMSGLDLIVKLVKPITVLNNDENGSVICDKSYATVGETVTLTVSPAEGYILEKIYINYGDGYSTAASKIGDNTYTFSMPNGAVTVTSSFAAPHISIVPVEGGTVQSDVLLVSGYVTLTATPAEGYVFNGIIITDENDKPLEETVDINLKGTWYTNVCKFHIWWGNNMRNVKVTPVFEKNLTADDGLYVNMLKKKSEIINVPSGVKSFFVYDAGGPSSIYTRNEIDTLVLVAPEGFVMHVSISELNLGKGTVLKIYDDDMTKYINADEIPELWNQDDETTKIITSSGKSISVFLEAGKAGEGFKFIVTLERVGYGAVTIVKREDGTSKAILDGNYGGEGELEAINIPKDIVVDKVDMTRSFPTKTYSTVVLPFDVKVSKDKSKANVGGLMAALRYNGIKTVDGKSSIRMKVVWAADYVIRDDNQNWVFYKDTVLNANTPYLVMMDDATFKVNNTEPITIKATTPADTSIDGWTFRGTWEYKKWVAGDSELGFAYGFAASESGSGDNKISVGDFVKVGEGAWIRPMRAYLVKSEISPKAQGVRANGNYVMRPSFAQEELPELMSVVIDHGDGDEEHTTVIGHFNTRTGEFKMNNDAIKRTFDVKGRNVGNKANKARGAYYGKNVKK